MSAPTIDRHRRSRDREHPRAPGGEEVPFAVRRLDLRRRIGAWLDLDAEWVRPQPTPTQVRADVWLAAVTAGLMVVWVELLRSLDVFKDVGRPMWEVHALALVGIPALAFRRRYPLAVTAATQVYFFVLGLTVPPLFSQLVVQLLSLFGLYNGVAWARNRRAAIGVVVAVIVFMFGWVAVDLAVGNSYSSALEKISGRPGLLPPIVAGVLLTILINAIFFFGGCVWGQNSWRSARDAAIMAEQSATIATQGEQLRERAVVDERLRIARELHDVVAHHVSVMGVQAGAARRVLDRRPDTAAEALQQVEHSSREAVREMRSLLGTLRASGEPAVARGPEPGLADLPDLVAQFDGAGLRVTYSSVRDSEGDAVLQEVSPQVALSVYRIVQESLSNVRAHSSARCATVVVRQVVGGGSTGSFVEVEVVDDGRPLGTTSGTGLGLLGMRERIAAQGGDLEVGPRLTGGYRVRARFPTGSARCP